MDLEIIASGLDPVGGQRSVTILAPSDFTLPLSLRHGAEPEMSAAGLAVLLRSSAPARGHVPSPSPSPGTQQGVGLESSGSTSRPAAGSWTELHPKLKPMLTGIAQLRIKAMRKERPGIYIVPFFELMNGGDSVQMIVHELAGDAGLK